jgi:hypothetical protein
VHLEDKYTISHFRDQHLDVLYCTVWSDYIPRQCPSHEQDEDPPPEENDVADGVGNIVENVVGDAFGVGDAFRGEDAVKDPEEDPFCW